MITALRQRSILSLIAFSATIQNRIETKQGGRNLAPFKDTVPE